VGGSEVGESDGLELGVADSLIDGCGVGVSVTAGVGALRSGSEVSVQPKKLERITTEPTAPTMRFVLLSDFKLNCLNGAV
jgi:hypothetical protein